MYIYIYRERVREKFSLDLSSFFIGQTSSSKVLFIYVFLSHIYFDTFDTSQAHTFHDLLNCQIP